VSGAVFLAGVVLLTALGSLLLWIRFREPRAWDARMREFSRTLEALSPGPPGAGGRRRDDGRRSRGRGTG
jgi:hypothetical protein